jgi:DNA polymerase-1
MSPSNKKVSHKLEDVAWRELGIALNKEHQTSDWCGKLTPEMLSYAARDAEVLLPLLETFEPRTEAAGLEKAMEIEHRALPALTLMANTGVPFDEEGWKERLKEIEEEKDRLAEKLTELAPDHPDGKGWNWNSAKQIKEAFCLLGIELPDTKQETLSGYVHLVAGVLVEYRKASKLLSTYGRKLLERVESGRIYASWWQIGAGTGRMACSSPNLQNLPPVVRRHVRAPWGNVLVMADYSQIELRIAAKISGDARMLEAFAEGLDVHEITARSLTGREEISKEDRRLAKAVNFGLLYGMSPKGLRDYARASYGVEMTVKEAERYWQDFFETYPGLKTWHDREWRELKKHGSTETRTLSGRRRTGVTKFTERLNSPVQGTGVDGLKLALALLFERRHECPGAIPILAVHDEIVVECAEGDAQKVEAWLKKAMVDGMDQALNASELEGPRVPVEVEVKTGRTWGE